MLVADLIPNLRTLSPGFYEPTTARAVRRSASDGERAVGDSLCTCRTATEWLQHKPKSAFQNAIVHRRHIDLATCVRTERRPGGTNRPTLKEVRKHRHVLAILDLMSAYYKGIRNRHRQHRGDVRVRCDDLRHTSGLRDDNAVRRPQYSVNSRAQLRRFAWCPWYRRRSLRATGYSDRDEQQDRCRPNP